MLTLPNCKSHPSQPVAAARTEAEEKDLIAAIKNKAAWLDDVKETLPITDKQRLWWNSLKHPPVAAHPGATTDVHGVSYIGNHSISSMTSVSNNRRQLIVTGNAHDA